MSAFYNEHDAGAAQWLRELIREGHIAPGVVDERDIRELREADLAGFTQVHLFAGIGGWSHALRLAGWPDERPVWTGSCPCQPFSDAGEQRGEEDDRHLWPDMRRLIEVCRPSICFGEQVTSALGRQWLSRVRADLEALGYGVGAADLCSAGAGEEAEGWFVRGDRLTRDRIVLSAPHIRPRLWWVADSGGARWTARSRIGRDKEGARVRGNQSAAGGEAGGLADADGDGRGSRTRSGNRMDAAERCKSLNDAEQNGGNGGLVYAVSPGLEGHAGDGHDRHEPGRVNPQETRPVATAGPTCVFWSAFDAIPCKDEFARPVEPGTFPLAHGVPGRVGLLRGYGNAINPHLAAAFITAYLEAREAAHA